MRNKGFFNIALYALGLLLCICAPLIATLSFFPIWINKGDGSSISGIALILILIAFAPMLKSIKSLLRTPSSYTVWLVIFVIFLLISKIAREVTVIAFTGFLGNLLGALCFKLSGIKRKRAE